MSDLFLGLLCRCKDEAYIEEFCDYYFKQGIDKIIIVDDNSNDKSIYNNLRTDNAIEIVFEHNIIARKFLSEYYQSIREQFEWLIYIDVDEFITTKRNSNKTIKQELIDTFSQYSCIKIPWVMMSCNNATVSPKSLLQSNIYRWNHDLRHPNPIHKFRCRYEAIEVKCIFRPSEYEQILDHHPLECNKECNVVDSVYLKSSKLDPWYQNLREIDIENAYMLCYHYRIISAENCIQKLRTNKWYIDAGYTLEDLMSSDHPEIMDKTLYER